MKILPKTGTGSIAGCRSLSGKFTPPPPRIAGGFIALALCAAAGFAGCRAQGVADGGEEPAPPKKVVVPITEFSVSFQNEALVAFEPGVFRYEGTVDGAVAGETLLIRAAAEEGISLEVLVDAMSKVTADAEVEVTDTAAPISGGAAVSIELRARRGGAMTSYTAEISPAQSEEDGDSTLQSLVVSYNSTAANRLTPSFSTEGLSYSMFAENGQNGGYVKAVASSSHASVEIWYDGTPLLGSGPTAAVERSFTLPGRNADKTLLVKVSSQDQMSNKLYTVQVFGYQDSTIPYSGTVSCSLDGYTIKGVTAISGAAGTQGAQIHFDTPQGGAFPWDFSAVETWVPAAYTVTLEKTEGDGTKRAIESVAFAAQAAQTSGITLAITAASQIGYRIFDANDFFYYLNSSLYRTENFALAANIDLNDYRDPDTLQPVDWEGPSNYQGILYGNGYTVKNLVLKPTSQNVGLFKSLGTGARLQDFSLEVSTSDPNAVYNNGLYFGGVVGTLGENVTGVSIEKVTVKGTLALGGTVSWLNIGGLVGVTDNNSSLTIKRCVSQLNIILNGGGSGSGYHCSFGGLVATADGVVTIENSYTTGNINLVHNLNRMLRAGGLVGCTWQGGKVTIDKSYAAGNVIAEKKWTGAWNAKYDLSAGGLAASSVDTGGSNITITNSAALNGSVLALCSQSPDTIISPSVKRANYGRLIGSVYTSDSATLTSTNNAALLGMKTGTSGTGTADNYDGGADDREGAGVLASALRSSTYWTNTLHWDASVWNFSGLPQGKWPTLK